MIASTEETVKKIIEKKLGPKGVRAAPSAKITMTKADLESIIRYSISCVDEEVERNDFLKSYERNVYKQWGAERARKQGPGSLKDFFT